MSLQKQINHQRREMSKVAQWPIQSKLSGATAVQLCRILKELYWYYNSWFLPGFNKSILVNRNTWGLSYWYINFIYFTFLPLTAGGLVAKLLR